MVDLYSRDTQAPALRRLTDLLAAVRAKSFLPDETRSGRFVEVELLVAQAVVDESQELLTSSDDSSTSVVESSSEAAEAEIAFIEGSLVRHRSYGTVHLVSSGK
eukprot:6491307-Amphidinium_carterae.1